MIHQDFISKSYSNDLVNGSVSFQSPSNIALVKYWGKYGNQLPRNTSISFTLSNCHTQTRLEFEKKSAKGFDFKVFLDESRAKGFEPKIKTFFDRIKDYIPFLEDYSFTINTSNSFPHSSGIASSASGMSALAMCLVEMESLLLKDSSVNEMSKKQKASFLARLGSGSAARSIEGPLVSWGEHPEIATSSNLYGTKYQGKVHSIFENYQDTILLVDKGEKHVSSTLGHQLMNENPYAEARFQTANKNIERLLPVFANGDVETFIKIVESEALQLHGMMMASEPYFILMKPNTLEIINRIWDFRNQTQIPVCFTLDAGANVHVLYPENDKVAVNELIMKDLAIFCQKGQYICDEVGAGAKML